MSLDIGADSSNPIRRIALYLPERDRYGQLVGHIEGWIEEALFLLTDINGGATRTAPSLGMYRTSEGLVVRETTHVVYSNIDPAQFFEKQGLIRGFIQRFMEEADQDSVLVEFDGHSHYVTKAVSAVVIPLSSVRYTDDR